jgi:hypothetical protein
MIVTPVMSITVLVPTKPVQFATWHLSKSTRQMFCGSSTLGDDFFFKVFNQSNVASTLQIPITDMLGVFVLFLQKQKNAVVPQFLPQMLSSKRQRSSFVSPYARMRYT